MNEPILHRTFTLRLERHGDDGRTLEGCCVPYGEAARVQDAGGPAYFEVFEAGAFARNLKAPNRIELRYEHRDGLADIIGRAVELSDETSGLYGTFRVFGGMIGDQALELVDEGILPGLSIGFADLRRGGWRRTPEGTVVREHCHLDEVSLCRTPSYAAALVTAHRSKAEMITALEIPTVDESQRDRLRNVGIRA
ncbi:MAG TPA: HK97 family phage prohead protease [Thermomicrobiales bacterium]|jgi:HK97 family phage prohead protease